MIFGRYIPQLSFNTTTFNWFTTLNLILIYYFFETQPFKIEAENGKAVKLYFSLT